jgi:preprotein translocase subunit YajC
MLELLAQETQSSNPLSFLLLPVLIIGAFYFVAIRPQQRRAKQQQALLRSVEVGDEVVTTAGVFGTIVDIDDETDVITLEIAPGTQVRMMRAGIGRRITEDDEYEEYDEDGEDYDDDEDGAGDDTSDEPQGPIQPA